MPRRYVKKRDYGGNVPIMYESLLAQMYAAYARPPSGAAWARELGNDTPKLPRGKVPWDGETA